MKDAIGLMKPNPEALNQHAALLTIQNERSANLCQEETCISWHQILGNALFGAEGFHKVWQFSVLIRQKHHGRLHFTFHFYFLGNS